ncbi:MAG: hypothetical protein QW348_07745 [Ignisphaera sp.]
MVIRDPLTELPTIEAERPSKTDEATNQIDKPSIAFLATDPPFPATANTTNT